MQPDRRDFMPISRSVATVCRPGTAPSRVLTLLAFWSGLAGVPAACTAGDNPPHWWEREPLRILNLVNSLRQTVDRPIASLVDAKADQAYNAEHLEVMGMEGGLDDQRLYFKTSAGRANPDYLGRYLPEAKRRGLRVIIYFNVHWYKHDFGARHPDWRQVRETGEPLTGVYHVGTGFCVNSPWREWVFQVLRDLAAYPIDGVFFDGPLFYGGCCYCRSCHEAYRRRQGVELEVVRARTGPAYRALIAFQAESVRDFLRDARRVLKSINPELAFYANGGGVRANGSRLNRVWGTEQDLIGTEGGVIGGDLTREPIWKPAVAAKLLETQAPDKPRVVFCAPKYSPWPFSVLPPAEIRLLYAESIANASNVWMGVMPPDLAQPEMAALAEMNRFLAAHAAYYLGTRSEADVALVWSDLTANFYQPAPAGAGEPLAEFHGLAEALVRAQVPFDVLDDTAIEREDLRRYAALFLPNVVCLGDAAATRLKDYVRQGGRLFATFETSRCDEAGRRRADWALSRVFGVSGPKPVVGPRRWDLMQTRSPDPLLEGIARELIPAPYHHVPVQVTTGRTAVAGMEPLAGPYEGRPTPSDEPAVVVNQFGAGAAVYVSGDLGAGIRAFHMPEWLRIVSNAARSLAPPRLRIRNAPESLDVTLRAQRDRGRLLLHLVNFTGEASRPFARVRPLRNLEVTLETKGKGPVKSVATLVHSQTLAFQSSPSGELHFELPEMGEYEVVVIEP
jgi:hypothetical protein